MLISRKLKILIVDDSKDVEQMFRVFQCPEIDYTAITNEAEALSLFTYSNKFDAVIVDLSMPNIDGLELVRQIRLNEKTHITKNPIRIAFWTGYPFDTDPDVLRVMKQENIEKVFKKPLSPIELTAQICEWLGYE